MKPRVIVTTKILAAALGAVGCNTSALPEPAPAVTAPDAPPAPYAATVASPAARSTVPDDHADPKLLALRGELDGEDRASVLAREAHFRPLCDKDGYPLVGNVNRKGGVQPSGFCADVRAKKANRT